MASTTDEEVRQKTSEERGGEEEEQSSVPDESMLETVKGRLEDLLSKQNLEKDQFIQQNINAQMYIPICILGSHEHIRSLNTNIATLIEAAKRSDRLGIDEDQLMVKPLLKAKRNTIILHDLPEDVSEEELNTMFTESPESKAFRSVKPDVNHTAFATFETDEAAQNAALWLRSQKLHGQMVKCSIKSEHFLRSFFPVSAITGSPSPANAPASTAWASSAWRPPSAAGPQGQPHGAWAMQMPASDAYGCGKGMAYMDPGAQAGMGQMQQWSNGWAQGGYPQQFQMPPQQYQQPQHNFMPEGKGGKKGFHKGGGGKQSMPQGPAVMPHAEPAPMPEASSPCMMGKVPSSGNIASGEQYFGGSQPDSDSQIGTGVVHGLENLCQGYPYEFRKYSRHDIVDLCNKMEEVEMPESFQQLSKNEHDAALFRETPNREWAPAPTPRTSFTHAASAAAAAAEGDKDRSRANTEETSAGGSADASNTAAWTNNAHDDGYSQSWGHYGSYDDQYWGGGADNSWGGGGGWGRGKDRGWSNRKSWATGSSQSTRSRWVEKNAKAQAADAAKKTAADDSSDVKKSPGDANASDFPPLAGESPNAAAAASSGERSGAGPDGSSRQGGQTWAEKARRLSEGQQQGS
mmetsp:Transcript_11852/g.27612  ORF Transcript_11852/g.27612 Transcript_11852/m.27612 type:complete len:632 (+) Transcript_11852:125-2020(+)